MNILEHFPLSRHTTFAVGGIVRYFAAAHTHEEIEEAYRFARGKGIPIVIFGGGSNTLIDDGEAEALFLQPLLLGIEHAGVTLTAAAGVAWDEVVAYAVEQSLYGLENLSGIPGSVGGAVVQNIGAYGAALSETIIWVEAFDTQAEAIVRLDNASCRFGYRDSVFKQQPGRFVIVRAAFSLIEEGEVRANYRDLAEYFADKTPTLQSMRGAVLSIRAHKFPDLTEEGTAGSFFKNPIVSLEVGEQLQQKYPNLPLFPLPEAAGYKVPLAWILDKALSMRGFSMHEVRCFEQQPLVLVAKRSATARAVRMLAHEVQQRVFAETNIVIEPEVCVMHGATIARTLNF